MREIYLDNSATTRVDNDIAELAARVMTEEYGNPSSLHKKGISAQLILDEARGKIAAALCCLPEEIVFTSGGTEANNLAMFGGVNAARRNGKTLVTAAWEHSSVLASMRELEKRGYTLKTVLPDKSGEMDAAAIAEAVDDDTALVSCMMVNSEVGAVSDIAELVRLVRRKNPKTLIHCDAVQGFGKLEFSVKKLGIDFLSVSGHKIHAPKGVGALYIKKTKRILPLMYGGGQERAVRPGTEPAALIAAFGMAAEKAAARIAENTAQMVALREHFVKKAATFTGLCMNSPESAAPYILNCSLLGYRSEIVLHYLAARGIFVSSGSACAGGKSSHVLAAMNLPRERADSALRVSFGKYNTTGDVDMFFETLAQAVKEIKV